MPTPFTGSDFSIQAVTQTGVSTIRVRYTWDPLASNPAGANDALNIANYTITGPVANQVAFAAVVPDDPQSINLTLKVPLTLGTWTLTGSSAIQTATARPLQAPTSGQFVVSFVASVEEVGGGAKNDSAEALIRKHLPPGLQGRAWNALIAALAVGDRANWDNAVLAFDQLFKSTASGLYLDRKAADDGVIRPPDVGMSDELLRKLAIKTTASKLTTEVILDIMEIFYGTDAVRASTTTALGEPFVLADGDTLNLLMDERDQVTVTFHSQDFISISQAKAVEVASVITRALRLARNRGFAVAFTNSSTGIQGVRIYSGSLGLSSSVRVTGGRAQLGLNFPSKLTTSTVAITGADAYNWAVTSPTPGTNRITLNNAGGTSKIDMTLVQPGDYVVFAAANSTIPAGIYTITDVGVSFSGAALVQYFDIAGTTANHSFLQLSQNELQFFRPQKQSIQGSSNNPVLVAQTSPRLLEVTLPATTQAVGRTIKTGAYPPDRSPFTVSSMIRRGSTVKVLTTGSHGLAVGDQVIVEEAFTNAAAPSVTVGNPGGLAITVGSAVSDYELNESLSTDLAADTSAYNVSLGPTNSPTVSTISGQTYRTFNGTNQTLDNRPQAGQVTDMQGSIRVATQIVLDPAFAATGTVYGFGGFTELENLNTLAELTITAARKVQFRWENGAGLENSATGNAVIALNTPTTIQVDRYLLNGTWYCDIYVNGTLDVSVSGLNAPTGGSDTFNGRIILGASWEGIGNGSNQNYFKGSINYLRVNTITAGMSPGTSDASLATIWTAVRNSDLNARSNHQMTTLNDGRVLLNGGVEFLPAITARATCELFAITATNTLTDGSQQYTYNWTSGGTMATARGWHRASVLTDATNVGKVLVTGGYNGTTVFTSTEIYTPNGGAGTWGAGPAMATARMDHEQIVLNDNRVVVIGGSTNATNATASCEYYNPNTNSFGAAPTMNQVRVNHRAVKLQDGRVLVVGGRDANSGGSALRSCEILDPLGGTWTKTGNLAYTRADHALVLFPDGRVLALGGQGWLDTAPEAALTSCEIWDPNTGCWQPAAPLSGQRINCDAIYLAGKKKILVAGGGSAYSYYYDIQTGTWRPTTTTSPTNGISAGCGNARMAIVNNDKVIMYGGQTGPSTPTQLPPWLYQPGEDVYTLGGLNGTFRVTSVPSATEFWYSTPDYSGLTTNQNAAVSIKPMAAVSGGNIPGPYIFNTLDGAAITGTGSEITQDLLLNQQYAALDVTDATVFPDAEGWLVIGFGTADAVFPVKYLGRLSSTSLRLDYSYKFPTSNKVTGFTISSATRAANVTTLTLNLGAGVTDHGIVTGQKIYVKSTSGSFGFGYKTITARTSTTISYADPGSNTTVANIGTAVVKSPTVLLLQQKGPYAPTNGQDLGSAYITASAAGRDAALQALDNAVAAAVNTEVTIRYPGDKGLGGAGTSTSDETWVWGSD